MFKNERLNSILKVLLVSFSLLGFIFLLFARSNFIISDTAWHLKVGEWIINNKQIPKLDTMSLLSSELNMNFMAHEWLFDVIFYNINKVFSLNGLIIITCLFTLISYVYVILKSKNLKAGVLISALFILVGFAKPMEIRPDTFSAIIFIVLGYNFLYESNKIKQYIVNILLTIFLVNIHGGMSGACIVQQIWFLLCYSVLNKKLDKNKLILLGTTFISSLINPYGLNIYKYMLIVNTEVAVFYSDWKSFSFVGVLQIFTVIILCSLCIYFYIKSENRNKLDLLVMFMYLVMLFRYQRTLNIFNFAFILYLGKYLDFSEVKKLFIRIGFIIINIISICLISLVILHEHLPNISMSEYITNNVIGKGVLDRISGTRYLNDISLGGFLIYMDEKPLIDTRSDPYLKDYDNLDLFSPYVKSMHSVDLMNKFTTEYNLDYLLLTRNNITSQIFYASSDWEVVCESNNCVLFKNNKKGRLN